MKPSAFRVVLLRHIRLAEHGQIHRHQVYRFGHQLLLVHHRHIPLCRESRVLQQVQAHQKLQTH